MAIITTNEVKTILGTTVSTYDTKIAALIPYVQEDLIEYTNNGFTDGYVYVDGALTVEPSTGGGDKIFDPNKQFVKAGFSSGMDVALEGGYANVGVYTLKAVASSVLTLTTTGLIEQDRTSEVNATGNIRVSRVKWPTALKLPAAKMVWHLIDKPTDPGVKSETLGDYSVTYAGSNSYPETVLAGLNKWRKVDVL